MKLVVGVAGEGQRREAGLLDLNAKLFAQFADQGGFRALARFDLAAREFPETGQLLALRPLGDQDSIVRVDLGLGKGEAKVWTCDLTKEYIAINGDYRS